MWNKLSGSGSALFNTGVALVLALLLSNAALGAEPRMSRHALIIGIGEYAVAGIESLHGVKHDMESAKRMAETMGIPTSNIRYLRDKAATLEGIRKEIRELEERINQGDRVFVYYSGHGTRYLDESISKDTCTEALMAADGMALSNRELGQLLKRIADKTDKLFVFYDACFSGGVATEPFQARSVMAGSRRFTPKVTAAKGADACYKPSNFVTRGLVGESGRAGFLPSDVVHVAASKPDQVSFDDGTSGGIATTAWRDCLLGEARDLDRSGAITIAEITACAQTKIDDVLRPQPNIRGQNMVIGGNGAFVPAAFKNTPPPVDEVAVAPTLGNAPTGLVQAPTAIPVALPAVQPPATPIAVSPPPAVPAQATAPAPPVAPAPTAPPAAPVAVSPPPAGPAQATAPGAPAVPAPIVPPPPAAPVAASPPPATAVPSSPPAAPQQAVAPALPEAVLAEIHAQRDAKRQVMVSVPNTSLRIGRDKLEFRISADVDGHVYVALAGSDGKSLYLLYPNDLARSNFLEAGRTLTLPGASWQITAGGPPGSDTLLVLVTDSPRDLGALGGSKEGPFMSSLNDQRGHARIQWMMGNSANAEQSDCMTDNQNRTRNLQVVRKCSDAFGAALVTIQERN